MTLPSPVPDLSAHVVADPAEARRRAAAGQHVLVVTDDGDALPRTEWMLTLRDAVAGARLDGEFPVLGELVELPTPDGGEVLASVSVAHRHRPAVVRERVGDGSVTTIGLRGEHVLVHPTVARFLSRVVRGDADEQRELGVGVVGYGPYGGMGTLHGLAATETVGLRLAAAADTVRDRLDAAVGDFPGINLHDSAESLADDPDVDVAIVATPPSVHADLARKLLQAGVHVVLEKPMCLTVADADGLLALAEQQDRVLTVHQSRRWDRDFLSLRRVVERGDLGEVFNLETFVGTYEHPCRAWHSDREISGGAVYDWGSHHVDWIVQLYGSAPANVVTSAHTRRWHDSTNVDQLHVWMRWDDGREATFRQSDLAAHRRPKFYVQGTEGTLQGFYRPLRDERLVPGRGYVDEVSHHAEAPVDLVLARHESGYGVTETTLPPAPHPGWGFHRNLADHLLLGEPLAVPPRESRDVVAVLEAAHRSMLAGGTVEPVDAS